MTGAHICSLVCVLSLTRARPVLRLTILGLLLFLTRPLAALRLLAPEPAEGARTVRLEALS